MLFTQGEKIEKPCRQRQSHMQKPNRQFGNISMIDYFKLFFLLINYLFSSSLTNFSKFLNALSPSTAPLAHCIIGLSLLYNITR